jgi:hypothetical protein
VIRPSRIAVAGTSSQAREDPTDRTIGQPSLLLLVVAQPHDELPDAAVVDLAAQHPRSEERHWYASKSRRYSCRVFSQTPRRPVPV